MKNVKKFLLTMAMTMALGTSAFAASGFEFIFQFDGGINYTIPTQESKDLGMNGDLGGFAGVDAQIGYMFQVKEGFGISLLAELGYSWDSYSLSDSSTKIPLLLDNGETAEAYWTMWQYYHNFKVGLLPKFNIGVGRRGAIALGIGGGVKIPMAGYSIIGLQYHYSDGNSSKFGLDGIDMKREDITDAFSPSVIGYVKVTFDYYLFFTDNIGMNFGFYLGGDFAPKVKELKIGGDAFDFGLQLGFRFGPKA